MPRYRRDEDAIADAIRDTRRGLRDAQRPTGTEKALTTQVAAQAGSDAAAALGVAEQAASEALSAQTTADGKNAIFVGMTDPIVDPEVPFAQGDLWYVTDVDGCMTMVKIWDGTSWAGYQFVADSIMVPGTVGATLISNGAVTTQNLSSDAIDGMTVTGALLRTAASGQRMQLDINGLRSFTDAEAVSATLMSDTGGIALTGSLSCASGSERATLTTGGIVLDNPAWGGGQSVRLTRSGISSSAASIPLRIEHTASGLGSDIEIYAQKDGKISITAGEVRIYNGQRPADTPIMCLYAASTTITQANATPNIGTLSAPTVVSEPRQSAFATGTNSPFTLGASRITVKEDGIYEFNLNAVIPGWATVGRTFIQFDGAMTVRIAIPTGEDQFSGSAFGQLLAGDVVTFAVFQTTGGTRTVNTTIRAAYLGPKT